MSDDDTGLVLCDIECIYSDSCQRSPCRLPRRLHEPDDARMQAAAQDWLRSRPVWYNENC